MTGTSRRRRRPRPAAPSTPRPGRSRPCRPSSSRRRGRAGSRSASSPVRMSADSAMKCTPQKTIHSRIRPGRGLLGELEGVAGDVGELDDLVALVVVAEHEDAVAERRLGRAGARDEAGVGGRRAGRRGTPRRARWRGRGRGRARAAAGARARGRRWSSSRPDRMPCRGAPSRPDLDGVVGACTRHGLTGGRCGRARAHRPGLLRLDARPRPGGDGDGPGVVARGPHDEVELLPLSDGGPGFLDVLSPCAGWHHGRHHGQ